MGPRLGKQPVVGWITIFSSYAIGLPLAALLCFKAGLALFGLWWGLLAGNISTASMCTFVLSRLNFEDESRKARLRSEKSAVRPPNGSSVYAKSPAKP